MIGKTVTSVHSDKEMIQTRGIVQAKAMCVMSAVNVYTQMYLGLSMYLYGHVSTAGWISILLTVPFFLLVYFLSRFLIKKCGTDCFSFTGSKAGKIIRFVFALMFLLDAELILYGLWRMLQEIMPEENTVLTMLAVVITVSISFVGNRTASIPRLCGLLWKVILCLMLYCAGTAIPYGQTAHFYPLLGYGWKRIVSGALWMCGGVSMGIWPLIMPQEQQSFSFLSSHSGFLLKTVLTAILLSLLTMLFSIWLMPLYALARPETMGWRLLLITNMTPSVPAWSMQVISLFFLFLLTLSYNLWQASALFSRIGASKKRPSIYLPVFAFLLFPALLCDHHKVQDVFTLIAPYRTAVTLGLLLLMYCISIFKRKKKQEAA